MINFVPGQRWINSAQPDLGLGTVIEVSHRTVTVAFVATEETRVFAIHNTPLSRVLFKVGDEITTQDKTELTVAKIEEEGGLIFYHANDADDKRHIIVEHELDHFLQLTRPIERLFSDQIDKNQWFELRYQALIKFSRFSHSDIFGLSGSRTSLLPHQLYIAYEVGRRYHPRVLLADEVGLGKTIEAGMIVQQQILREQAKRILLIVPETLLHQWLVEMLRRFNLHFSLFNAERFTDAIESEPDQNPFHSAQLVLCSMDFILANEQYQQALLSGEWDCLVVDEAHHLHWDDNNPAQDYHLIETLADQIPSVLLLTATPEQLGKQSHFARLRLLDKNRFNSYEIFLKDEQSYEPIAEIIECLLENRDLQQNQLELLTSIIQDENILAKLNTYSNHRLDDEHKHSLINQLLDQEGTGRLLFRNTRASVGGFPERNVYPYVLASPEEYQVNELSRIQPEIDQTGWTDFDPRVAWLLDFLQQHPDEKALLITAHASTAMDLSEHIRIKSGLHTPVFHEGMSIIERDRAAAFFADEEDGCQLLLCSEIGGEGRNFQFAKHLILFDLPLNPDLLEQRIGRIDRIGQGDNIHIHVPYIEDSAQAVLLHWYYSGLNALQAPCPAASAIFQQFEESISSALKNRQISDSVLSEIQQRTLTLNEQLHDGRDKLLELNSYRKDIAESLIKQLSSNDAQTELRDYMKSVFDCFGVDCEVHSEKAYVIHPSDTMVEVFPGLPDEGATITFDRETALKYETMQFLSWEHEIVTAITESILIGERGNVAVVSFSNPAVQEGLLLLECLFTLDIGSHVKPYLTQNLVRTVIGEDIRDYNKALSHDKINMTKEFVKQDVAKQIIKAKRKELETLVQLSQKQAEKNRQNLIDDSLNNVDKILGSEITRLQALAQVNLNVREEEIDYFQQTLVSAKESLVSATLRVDAIRVLVAT